MQFVDEYVNTDQDLRHSVVTESCHSCLKHMNVSFEGGS